MELSAKTLRKRITVGEHGCWLYKGPRDANGYGRVFVDGKERKAQRVYYEAFIGEIPKGARLKHHLAPAKCLGATCCNPAHVEVKQTYTSVVIAVASRVCKQGHAITGSNALVEQRGDNLLVRCRTCRQEAWRKEKRKPKNDGERL